MLMCMIRISRRETSPSRFMRRPCLQPPRQSKMGLMVKGFRANGVSAPASKAARRGRLLQKRTSCWGGHGEFWATEVVSAYMMMEIKLSGGGQ